MSKVAPRDISSRGLSCDPVLRKCVPALLMRASSRPGLVFTFSKTFSTGLSLVRSI